MYWSRQYLSIGPKKNWNVLVSTIDWSKKKFATPTLTPIPLKLYTAGRWRILISLCYLHISAGRWRILISLCCLHISTGRWRILISLCCLHISISICLPPVGGAFQSRIAAWISPFHRWRISISLCCLHISISWVAHFNLALLLLYLHFPSVPLAE